MSITFIFYKNSDHNGSDFKIFDEPIKFSVKSKIDTKNKDYVRPIGNVEVIVHFSNTKLYFNFYNWRFLTIQLKLK